ncbi:NupC/NupG family nucleoside CNT transporter [Oceanobacillus neutriphilus]|nr:NupC/NupG family nucleoside CNT transporter [Oceanobacillus neutriphilus]
MNILWGIGGIVVVLGLALLVSVNRKAIKIRTISIALALQVFFGFIVLKWEAGKNVLEGIANVFGKMIDSSAAGIDFLFGGVFEGENIGFVFAFQVLPTIIFVASFISILYYLGIMQFIVKHLGGALSRLLKTSKAESISAAANIFMGHTEAPLTVKPYISRMTQSEIFTIMAGGLATVSGANLAGYYILGIPLEYLLAASFMAAPAGLLMAKMIVPETEISETANKINLEIDDSDKPTNVIDAAAKGAGDGLKIALNVGAMLAAFISLIALVNLLVGGVGSLFGYDKLSIELIFGYIFSPLAFIMGIPMNEALVAGSLLGQKVIINEMVAYVAFIPEMASLSDKTNMIVSFALCGFANIGSTAILIGTIGGMAPNKRSTVAKFAIRAVIAGTLANLLSASIAGMFF